MPQRRKVVKKNHKTFAALQLCDFASMFKPEILAYIQPCSYSIIHSRTPACQLNKTCYQEKNAAGMNFEWNVNRYFSLC
jgi:hypothetical protein